MDTEPSRARKESRQAVRIRRTVRPLPELENRKHLQLSRTVNNKMSFWGLFLGLWRTYNGKPTFSARFHTNISVSGVSAHPIECEINNLTNLYSSANF